MPPQLQRISSPCSVVALASVAILLGCSGPTHNGDSSSPGDAGQKDVSEVSTGADAGPSCEVRYELPEGKSFALEAHTINEPERIVQLAGSFVGELPPVLLFVEGLTEATQDEVELAGGAGARVGYGYDEVPDTEADVYAMYYASINADTCDFGARLEGEVTQRQLVAYADTMDLDLTGLASFTEGVRLRVADVELRGDFDEELRHLNDVIMTGHVADDGLDELIEAVQDQISLSKEQVMAMLGPDEDGRVPVEVVLDGRRVVVEGFTDPGADSGIEGRAEAGSCCPDGLNVGDSVIPYLHWDQQGIDDRQAELFEAALPSFRDDPHVAMVLTARQSESGTVHYEVYSGGAVEEGKIVFERRAGDAGEGPNFTIVDQSGENPLSLTEVTALSAYEEILAAGTNPEQTEYLDRGYTVDDPRLAFVPADQMHYPLAKERIAQIFDDPRAGDLIVIPASWSTGGFSTHGNLSTLQSRIPLVVAGPGVRSAESSQEEEQFVREMGDGAQALIVDRGVRQVDIAPTVAAALGVEQSTGVGPDMRLGDDLYLGWQDGRVLEELFTDEALAAIAEGQPVVDRAVIIVNDGLSHPEIFHQVFTDDPEYDVDAYRHIFGAGAAYAHGAISNFPANSYPGHQTLASGAWAGHHGVVDNSFWAREQAMEAALRGAVFATEHLFGSAHESLPVETIFEAVTRTFGDLDDGVLAASINTPATRGAQLATFEHRRPDEDFQLPDDATSVDVGGESLLLPPAEVTDHTEIMDNSTVQTFAALYQDHQTRGDDGLPIPKVSVINFGSTDTAGHSHGPHGDGARYEVISRTNQRLGVVMEVLKSLDLDDSTLVVLTADHGMELQDQSRSSARGRALSEAGIQVRSSGWFFYFKELAVHVEALEGEGEERSVFLRVVDRATESSDKPIGVAGVTVEVVEGGEGAPAMTNDDGYVELAVTPTEGGDAVLLQVDHPQWNDHRKWIKW